MESAPLPRRKARNWRDVELIVSSISVAVTLGLWSLWASREKSAPPAEVGTLEPSEPTITPTEPLILPGQVIYLGGATPQAPAPVANQTNQDQPKHPKGRGGGGRGGGGGANASTGSS